MCFVSAPLLHGFYLVIYAAVYALCIWVLIRRRREKYLWHIISSTILFALASLQVGVLIPIFRLAITLQTELTELCSSQLYTISSLPALQAASKLTIVLNMSILLSL